MRRQSRPHYSAPGYPDLRAAPARRAVLEGLGAIAVVTVASGCRMPPWPGTPPDDSGTTDSGDTARIDTGQLAGDIGPSGETVYLPSETEWRTLYFSAGGFIDYRVMVYTEYPSLAAWLRENVEAALAALDVRFDAFGVHVFAVGDAPDPVEAAAVHVLADAFHGAEGAPIDEFQSLAVYVGAWDSGESVDGDVAPPDTGGADTGSR